MLVRGVNRKGVVECEKGGESGWDRDWERDMIGRRVGEWERGGRSLGTGERRKLEG